MTINQFNLVMEYGHGLAGGLDLDVCTRRSSSSRVGRTHTIVVDTYVCIFWGTVKLENFTCDYWGTVKLENFSCD